MGLRNRERGWGPPPLPPRPLLRRTALTVPVLATLLAGVCQLRLPPPLACERVSRPCLLWPQGFGHPLWRAGA